MLGGAVVDMVAKPKEATELLMGTSNPGSCVESDGGVGRNVAEALGRLGCNPVLYSAVGSDLRGQGLLERLHDCGCANRAAVVKDTPTATYLAVLNGSGELHVAIANMAVLEEIAVPPTQVFEQANARFLVMDANPTVAVLKETVQMATKAGLEGQTTLETHVTGKIGCIRRRLNDVAETNRIDQRGIKIVGLRQSGLARHHTKFGGTQTLQGTTKRTERCSLGSNDKHRRHDDVPSLFCCKLCEVE